MIKNTIKSLQEGKTIAYQEAFDFQTQVLNGGIDTSTLLNVFRGMSKRDLTGSELLGFVTASQKFTLPLPVSDKVLDVVGTGGDGHNTINISTISAILASKIGQKVVKHGNRAASSKCGSADLLEAIGYKIELNPEEAKKELEKNNFVFAFAKVFNPGFRFAAKARKEYRQRTYFNLLGPMLNPSKPSYMLLGLSDWSKADLVGEVVTKSGAEKVWLVQSGEGMDELSTSSVNKVKEFRKDYEQNNFVKEFSIEVRDYGLESSSLEDLKGGDAQYNAQIFEAFFESKAPKAITQTIILNTACALVVCGKYPNIKTAVTEVNQFCLKLGK